MVLKANKIKIDPLSVLQNNVLNRGISVRNFNYLMALFTLIISTLLLFSTYQANEGYLIMQHNTKDYIQWQNYAYDMQIASEYLTDQARNFVETGKLQYLNNYFTEIHVNQRREKSLNSIKTNLEGTKVFEAIQKAMNESNALMVFELYAMKLTAAAYKIDFSKLPKKLQEVALTRQDEELSSKLQEKLARSIVFNQLYRKKRAAISENMKICMQELAKVVENLQTSTSNDLQKILSRQQWLIIFLISITIATMLLTLILVIRPLIKAVLYIHEEQPIPIRGSYEFQFLAKTYNVMFKNTHAQKEHLAYEATHDKLTGVYNRAGYNIILEKVDLATCAFMIIDVDKFKHVNDTYGHEVGDLVLKKIACVLKDNFRSQDYVCRIGGDEFIVIAVRIKPSLVDIIKRKFERINNILSNPDPKEKLPPITLSCGVAFGADEKTEEIIFHEADEALYKVKNGGRNGCEFAL